MGVACCLPAEVLEEIVESLRDSNALPKLIQTYLSAGGARCPVESKSNVPQLSVVDLFGVIVIFFTTAILSTIQLLWTFFIKKRIVKGAAPHPTPSGTDLVSIRSADPAKGSLLADAAVGESVIGCESSRANDDNETYGNNEAPASGRTIAVLPPQEPHRSTAAEILPNRTLNQQRSDDGSIIKLTSSTSLFPERPLFTE